MRTEEEIRNELQIAEPRLKACKEHRLWMDATYYEGYVDALKWVLGEKED